MGWKGKRACLSAGLILAVIGLGANPAPGLDTIASGFWDAGSTWAGGIPPSAADDVVIKSSHTVTNRDVIAHAVNSLTIETGAVLTHSANGSTELYKVILNVTHNLTVDAGGQINVDGNGYKQGSGPGLAPDSSGSGYGGIGGTQRGLGAAGTTYGSINAPTNLGSGGFYAYTGHNGGGAVLLTVGGTTTVEGAISASGTYNPTYAYYGPSGGSVFIRTGYIAGSGTISARGAPVTGSSFCGGGGGRVAVILTVASDFGDVRMDAYAASGYKNGAGGTVYLQHPGHTPGQGILIVDYTNITPYTTGCVTLQNGLAASACQFSSIILTNGGLYGLDTNDVLTVPSATTIQGDPANTNDGLWVGGTLNVPADMDTITSNYYVAIYMAGASIAGCSSLTVATNALLRINAPFTFNGPVTVEGGGVIDHSFNGSAEYYKIDLTVIGNLDVRQGGAINADGKGYSYGTGPGRYVSGNSGGGYGGVGGSRYADGLGGTTYGSITAPTNIGSGGMYNVAPTADGGGAIRLVVTGTAIVNGVISASAPAAFYSGSGGSVFLTAGALSGNGTIRANAPAGSWCIGGGGRVAVILTNGLDFASVAIEAKPSLTSSGVSAGGGAGTVYLQTRDQADGCGMLIVNGSASAKINSTLVSTNVLDAFVGTVAISNAGILEMGTNSLLVVNGSWTNQGVFIAREGSTVQFAGPAACGIAGSNDFYNLVITSVVTKAIAFESGRTNTVRNALVMDGLTIDSSASPSWAYLALDPAGSQAIRWVTVRNNNASGGQTLFATRGVDGGNNVNWEFPFNGTLIMVK